MRRDTGTILGSWAVGLWLGLGLLMIPEFSRAGSAAEENAYAHPGLYVGLSAVAAVENFAVDDAGDAAGVDIDAQDSYGVDIRAGYRFHPRVAAEIDFQYLEGFDFEADGSKFGDAEVFAFMLNGKVFLFTGPVQPYALFGIGIVTAQLEDIAVDGSPVFGIPEDESDFSGRVGGGVDVYLTRNLVGEVELAYSQQPGSLEDLPFLSIVFGFQYRFDTFDVD